MVWSWVKDRTDVPTVALGHSVGEFAALVAAGSISLPSAIQLCWERGRIAERAVAGLPGRMAAMFTSPVQASQLTSEVPGAFIATVNGPGLCVIAGWSDAVEEVLARASAQGISSSRLDVTVPFHTPLLEGAVKEFRALLERTPVAPPSIPAYSAARNGLYDSDPGAIRDALAGLYVSPVRLDQFIQAAAGQGARLFVECGTGRSLSRSVDAVLHHVPHLALAGVSTSQADLARLEAGLWVAGITPETAKSAPVAAAESAPFGLFTPASVPAEPAPGREWRGTSIVLAVTRPHRLASELTRELSAAGASLSVIGVRELTGDRHDMVTRPAADLAALVSNPASPSWLIWLSADAGIRREPLGTLDAAATMAELACLRTVTAGLAGRWEGRDGGGLLVITRMDGRLGDSRSLLDPTGAALAGFTRALGQEHPTVSTTLVDLGQDLVARAAARRIADLGCPPPGHHEWGTDTAGWWTTELTALPGPGRGPGGSVLDALSEPGAVVLASGGTTGIVAHMLCTEAERLSGSLPGWLMLLSRTPAAADGARLGDKKAALITWRRDHPGRSLHEFERDWARQARAIEARATISRLENAGIRVEHQVIDVCDTRAIRALGERLRLENMTIRTIVHGAGVERSSRITEKPAEEWAATAAVKIMGFHALVDAATGHDLTALRLVVTHGSLSGSLGLPGQTDYAAGNEYLAKATARLQAERPGLVAQYIGWPAWNDVGMAAVAETKRRLEGMGLRYLNPAEGARWAAEIVGRAAALPSQTIVLPVPLPPTVTARTSAWPRPAERWWLVDTVSRHNGEAIVRRLYDSADPRDSELRDHRVRDRPRIAAVQIVEHFAEAFLALLPHVTGLELRDIVLHQGLVLSTNGRRPVTVTMQAGDDGRAMLRMQSIPLLAGDLPGPGTVLAATACAVAIDGG